MHQSTILNDLDYVKAVAESGRNAPLLGGRFGLWWGTLLCITLFVHWTIATGRSGITEMWLGALWFGFGVTGMIGSAVLGKTMTRKPGSSAVGNKAANAIWSGNTIFLFLFGASAGFSAAFGVNDFEIMNIMMPVAFGVYGMTAFVLSRLADQKWLLAVGIAGFAFVPLTLFILTSPNLYLVSIVGVLLTIVIPGAVQLRSEPKVAAL